MPALAFLPRAPRFLPPPSPSLSLVLSPSLSPSLASRSRPSLPPPLTPLLIRATVQNSHPSTICTSRSTFPAYFLCFCVYRAHALHELVPAHETIHPATRRPLHRLALDTTIYRGDAGSPRYGCVWGWARGWGAESLGRSGA